MNPALPPDVIEEAIMAFDAGNHAWGRYRHFVLSASPELLAVSTAEVREALAETAISVVDAQAGDYTPLLDGLRRTLAALERYRARLSGDAQLQELEEAAGDFAEAIALLAGEAQR
jgi:hypothetical protein